MKNILKGFALAISMLSIIPFFKVHNFNKGINGYAVMFYPLVGFFLGTILWLSYLLISTSSPSYHVAIIIFAIWITITGALHIDGFSDTVDGLFVSKARAIEVMKDSNVGGMGMTFTVVFLILKASSLTVFQAFYLLPIILMLSRFNAVVAIYLFPYITKNGMGTLAKQELKFWQVGVAFLYVIILSYSSLWLIVVSLLVLTLCAIFFMKRYRGFSGDIYGFSIEVTELVLLNVVLSQILR